MPPGTNDNDHLIIPQCEIALIQTLQDRDMDVSCVRIVSNQRELLVGTKGQNHGGLHLHPGHVTRWATRESMNPNQDSALQTM
jgi:hypothetical protein